jgi:hypothetical protein
MLDKEKLLEDVDRLINCLTNLKDALQYEEYCKKLEARSDFTMITTVDIKMLGLHLDGAFNKQLPKP